MSPALHPVNEKPHGDLIRRAHNAFEASTRTARAVRRHPEIATLLNRVSIKYRDHGRALLAAAGGAQ